MFDEDKKLEENKYQLFQLKKEMRELMNYHKIVGQNTMKNQISGYFLEK